MHQRAFTVARDPGNHDQRSVAGERNAFVDRLITGDDSPLHDAGVEIRDRFVVDVLDALERIWLGIVDGFDHSLGSELLPGFLGVLTTHRPADLPATGLANTQGDLFVVPAPGVVHVAGEHDLFQHLQSRFTAQRDVPLIVVGVRVVRLGPILGRAAVRQGGDLRKATLAQHQDIVLALDDKAVDVGVGEASMLNSEGLASASWLNRLTIRSPRG